eukprot:10859257-Prorocentrum_lima.AAC.1
MENDLLRWCAQQAHGADSNTSPTEAAPVKEEVKVEKREEEAEADGNAFTGTVQVAQTELNAEPIIPTA